MGETLSPFASGVTDVGDKLATMERIKYSLTTDAKRKASVARLD